MIFFFFNDTPTTEIYTLSLHDALPIYALLEPGLARHCERVLVVAADLLGGHALLQPVVAGQEQVVNRSEEHTSELQSHVNLVCRLLLEKKKKKKNSISLN